MPNANASAPAAPPPSKIPPSVAGIDVNHCKTPSCPNFCVPVPQTIRRGRNAVNPYVFDGGRPGAPRVRCNACGEGFTLKSNLGVFEEAYRLLEQTYPAASCPEPLCENHRVPTRVPGAYHAFGATPIGSARYRCKACGKTFSVKPAGINPIAKQRQSDKNRTILSMLVGKMPLRRICEAADVHPEVLYERIDFFHGQALAFLADRERGLADMEIPRLYVGVDRQENVVNWSRRKDKRNVTLSSVAAADNATGYVFGMHPNFDPELDAEAVEERHRLLGQTSTDAPSRRFARLWLQSDYAASLNASASVRSAGDLPSSIAAVYAEAGLKPDVEAREHVTAHDKLPDRGVLVHSELTVSNRVAIMFYRKPLRISVPGAFSRIA